MDLLHEYWGGNYGSFFIPLHFFTKLLGLLQCLVPIMDYHCLFIDLLSSSELMKALWLIEHHDLLLCKEIRSAFLKEDCLYTISSLAKLLSPGFPPIF